MPKSHL